ncbi:MAG: DUF5666 domain-containing protein [Gammaproteobacteria bacterium]
MKKFIEIFFLAITIAIAGGCGGGGRGGGGGGGIGPLPGIDRLGVKSGTVTGFGSIIVNGVEFEVSGSAFDIDDNSSSSGQSDLSIGDVVVVTFDPAAPTVATTVFSDDAVEGPIDSIDLATSTMVVAGQTVAVDPDTSFDDSLGVTGLDGLTPDTVVEVTGLFEASGNIRATRVEPSTAPGVGEFEVHGFVTGLTATTFMINALTVDFSSATIDNSFPGGMISENDFVEAKGTALAGGVLTATKVEPDAVNGIDTSTFSNFDEIQIEIEGFITRFGSSGDFDVSGFPVDASGATFTGGVATDLALNVKVEVEGDRNASGKLVARKVDIRRSNNLRVVGQVDSKDDAAGTLTVLGITATVDGSTRREDKSSARLEPFNLSDVMVDDYVEVRGGADPASAGDILASLLERDDLPGLPGEGAELRGFIDSITLPNNFTIAGVDIDASNPSSFLNLAGNTITVNDLQVGDLVDVKGTETGMTMLAADEIQLEN